MTTTTTRPPVRIPATRNHQLRLRLAAVNRGRAAARIAEAGRMARAARAQVTR